MHVGRGPHADRHVALLCTAHSSFGISFYFVLLRLKDNHLHTVFFLLLCLCSDGNNSQYFLRQPYMAISQCRLMIIWPVDCILE